MNAIRDSAMVPGCVTSLPARRMRIAARTQPARTALVLAMLDIPEMVLPVRISTNA